ncbi:hypothetical protein BDZ89DRAFT_1071242 [Hymenopellis radicata]|nr:hypothetical protein BDZ89DRAFT_1071242 [Hymenopellis radicata]
MSKPRQSGIPTPGRPSGIPGRSRSSSSAGHNAPVSQSQHDVDAMSRAFADAIRANDPSQHRNSLASVSSASSLSPPAAPFNSSTRPASVASSSRPKTPSYARPLSRQSERSSSRAGRAFEVGDNVRIESLGFEGKLRYIGEIDGKPGLWAGVELGGGFAGKGKNNGTVGGKHYFSCPLQCGVFIATTKLSAPTVGAGAVHRPPSVTGRITPSVNGPSTSHRSGRPSLSNGRVTPSNGRVTPASNGRITPSSISETPAARAARLRALTKKPATTPSAAKTPTPGTRASKYAGMTAKQLSTINATPDSKIASPGAIARSMSSPSRSPFATPKPRAPTTGIGTPRARMPSGGGMLSSADLDQKSRDLQARIASLTKPRTEDQELSPVDLKNLIPSAPSSPRRTDTAPSSPRATPSSPRRSHSSIGGLRHRPTSSLSSITDERVDALLDENERLRADLERLKDDVERLKEEKDNTQHVAAAEAQVVKGELDKVKADATLAAQEAEVKMSEWQTALTAAEESKATQASEFGDTLSQKEQSVRELEDAKGGLELDIGKLKKTVVDLEDERHDLMGQVDELRQAGQETIALYEERLRACDVQRYELEDHVAELEARLRATPPLSASLPAALSPPTVTGTEIDNETLRDHVVHLQKKIATLEDMIEDSRAAADKEEVALRDKMRRVKEKEDAMRREVNEGKKEAEAALQREEMARRRIEEIEEALRESTVALENARAEVEGLRIEVDNLNGLVSSQTNSEGTLSSKVAEVTQRASLDKDRFVTEIADLKRKLDESRSADDPEMARKNAELQQIAEEQVAQLSALHQKLDDQAVELETLRKKINREAPPPATPTKHDLSAAREEIKGLKHIVRQLQEEAVTSAQRYKTLESENQLLITEMDQLRQEVKILEENIDQSIMREEAELNGAAPSDSGDFRALKLKYESEIEQLRKRTTDAEMKSARVQHDDELEQEIERLKEKVARQKKSSGTPNSTSTYHRGGSSTSLSSIGTVSSEIVCEICERPGHDIFNCDLLKEGTSTPSASLNGKDDLFCEDCEGYGHVSADCPHSLDVF